LVVRAGCRLQPDVPTDRRGAFAQIPGIVDELLRDAVGPPVDLSSIASSLRVESVDEEYGLPFSGALQRAKFGYRVVCAAEQPRPRKRFTIAHEMGHAFLFSHYLGSTWTEGEVEAFCDRFAAELLMPTHIVLPILREELSLAAFADIAELFEVSLHSAAIRISQLTEAFVFFAKGRDLRWASGPPRLYDPYLASVAESVGRSRKPHHESLWDHRWRCSWAMEAAPLRGGVIMMLRREDEK
jgi:hypothetical protein